LLNCPGMDNDELSLEAIEDYTQAIRLEPDNPEWRLRRGNFYYLLGLDSYPQASTDYEAALSLRPNVGLYLTLGNLYYALEEMDDAVGAYTRAIETAAPEAVSGGYVGMVILDEVVQARPDWALAYYNRSQHHKDAAGAYDDLQRAAELDPGHYNSHWLLGWRAYENGDYERSAEISGIAAALKPTEPRPHFNQGLALVALGDVESATRAFEAGIAAAEAMTRTEIALARYDEALGDLADVADDPAGIADVFRARLTFKQALVYVKSGDTDQARLTYEAGIAIAATLTDRKTRLALYDEALADLPPEQQAQLIALLESARDE